MGWGGGVVWVCACEGVDSKCGGGERGCCVCACEGVDSKGVLCGYVHVRLWIVSVVVGRGGVVWVCACEVVDSKCGGGERGCCVGMCM